MQFQYYYPFEEHKSRISFPNIPRIGGRLVFDVCLEELESISNPVKLVTYGVNENDYIILPDTIYQIQLKKRQVQVGSQLYEYFINVIRNGKGSWLSLAALNRKDYNNDPIHPVSEFLIECSNPAECILAVLGKTIIARKMVEYSRYKFANGVRTHEIEHCKTAYLEFD